MKGLDEWMAGLPACLDDVRWLFFIVVYWMFTSLCFDGDKE